VIQAALHDWQPPVLAFTGTCLLRFVQTDVDSCDRTQQTEETTLAQHGGPGQSLSSMVCLPETSDAGIGNTVFCSQVCR
jgi:hypothetical protein